MLKHEGISLEDQTIVDKLSNDFDLLTKLKIIHKNLPPSYS